MRGVMLERYELEAFLTLAEELHFGRTAERLHVSTSRISQTIARLERRAGVPLFDRTSRRVELTPVGRRLYEEVRPAWDRIATAFEEAVATGRGLTGVLRCAFLGPAGGQLLSGVAGLFRERLPGCDVRLVEVRPADLVPWLRDGEVDVALGPLPVREPGIASGPSLVSEARMLAVSSRHPFARRESVRLQDLARVRVLRLPGLPGEDPTPAVSSEGDRTPPGLSAEDRTSSRSSGEDRASPAGWPVEAGPPASTLDEVLTLVGEGRGVLPVGAHTRRYHPRPDVTYVPFDDAPPVRWGLLWRTDGATARVLAFAEAARDLLSPAGRA
ncbi:LysR substrate-binding domain-containing protein [Streptosporangium sp. NPDC050855]|uniref:LysR substrate-binding domain-containing protein n=1 Tax=Streptosporangium sp. NPDC050855 TaxID=3366194 RepID=UPI003796D8A0